MVNGPRMRSRLRLGALCALLSIPALYGAQGDDHAVLRGRLVFSYFDRPAVGVLDLDTGEVTHRFDVSKPNARLIDTPDGRIVFVVPGDEGSVQALDTGLVVEAHGDHSDLTKLSVRFLGPIARGERPSHITAGFGAAAVFYDGPRPADHQHSASVTVVRLESVVRQKGKPETLALKGSQHGIAVPVARDLWAVTTPKADYQDGRSSSLPNGFRILDKSQRWKAIASFDDIFDANRSCKELHGHAALRGIHVFGCDARGDSTSKLDGGVLILMKRASRWTSRKLPYPDHRRASTLKAGETGSYVVANYGSVGRYDALLRIDPGAASLSESRDVFAIPDGQPVCQFGVSPDGRRVANLLPDGTLRIYEIAPDWKEVAKFEAVAPFDCAFEAKGAKPALAVRGGRAFISDPFGRRIREFDVTTLRQGADLTIDGQPGAIAARD